MVIRGCFPTRVHSHEYGRPGWASGWGCGYGINKAYGNAGSHGDGWH